MGVKRSQRTLGQVGNSPYAQGSGSSQKPIPSSNSSSPNPYFKGTPGTSATSSEGTTTITKEGERVESTSSSSSEKAPAPAQKVSPQAKYGQSSMEQEKNPVFIQQQQPPKVEVKDYKFSEKPQVYKTSGGTSSSVPNRVEPPPQRQEVPQEYYVKVRQPSTTISRTPEKEVKPVSTIPASEVASRIESGEGYTQSAAYKAQFVPQEFTPEELSRVGTLKGELEDRKPKGIVSRFLPVLSSESARYKAAAYGLSVPFTYGRLAKDVYTDPIGTGVEFISFPIKLAVEKETQRAFIAKATEQPEILLGELTAYDLLGRGVGKLVTSANDIKFKIDKKLGKYDVSYPVDKNYKFVKEKGFNPSEVDYSLPVESQVLSGKQVFPKQRQTQIYPKEYIPESPQVKAERLIQKENLPTRMQAAQRYTSQYALPDYWSVQPQPLLSGYKSGRLRNYPVSSEQLALKPSFKQPVQAPELYDLSAKGTPQGYLQIRARARKPKIITSREFSPNPEALKSFNQMDIRARLENKGIIIQRRYTPIESGSLTDYGLKTPISSKVSKQLSVLEQQPITEKVYTRTLTKVEKPKIEVQAKAATPIIKPKTELPSLRTGIAFISTGADGEGYFIDLGSKSGIKTSIGLRKQEVYTFKTEAKEILDIKPKRDIDTISSTKLIQEPKTETFSDTSQKDESKRKIRSGVSVRTELDTIPEVDMALRTKLEQKTDLKLDTATETKQEQQQDLVIDTIKTPKTILRPKTGYSILEIPKQEPPKLPKYQINLDSEKPKNKGFFSVQVRRKGLFRSEGVFSSEKEAVRAGLLKTTFSAAASFRVKSGGSVIKTGVSSSRFYSSKREPGVIIQKAKYRISSAEEKREITFKGIQASRIKKKRKSIFGGL